MLVPLLQLIQSRFVRLGPAGITELLQKVLKGAEQALQLGLVDHGVVEEGLHVHSMLTAPSSSQLPRMMMSWLSNFGGVGHVEA